MRRIFVIGMAAGVVIATLTPRVSVAATFEPPSEALEDAGRLAMELVESRPDDYTGARIDGTSNRLTVSLPAGNRLEERKNELLRLLSDSPTAPAVDFVTARYSKAALGQFLDRIMVEPTQTGMEAVTAIGEDSMLGLPVIYLSKVTDATRAQVQDAFGADIRVAQGGVAEPTIGRRLDPAPHWGGAGYKRWNPAHTAVSPRGECSISFPVAIGSNRYELTAAHCMPGQTPYLRAWAEGHSGTSVAYYFGAMTTTTISGAPGDLRDGSQDLYGDWALLNGSTYSPKLYNGPIDSSSSLSVGAVNYNAPPVGSQVCSSGRTTASKCRLFVLISNMRIRLKRNDQGDTIWVNRITQLYSDQNLDGLPDDPCSGWDLGDSGGPIYQGISGRPGYARAMGVVTAQGRTGWPDYICTYSYTQLNGLRAWNANASVIVAP